MIEIRHLALQPRALADEEVVEVSLQRLLVHVEDLAAQVQTQRPVGPPENRNLSVMQILLGKKSSRRSQRSFYCKFAAKNMLLK
jgi:hypothetical protein